MWRSKKFIGIAFLAVAVIAGSLGGVALAQSGDEAPANGPAKLIERVTQILNDNGVTVTTDQLQSAVDQALKETRDEALQARLQALVDKGVLTQDEADQYKAWLDARPDVNIGPRLGGAHMFESRGWPGGRFGGKFGGMMRTLPTQ